MRIEPALLKGAITAKANYIGFIPEELVTSEIEHTPWIVDLVLMKRNGNGSCLPRSHQDLKYSTCLRCSDWIGMARHVTCK